MNKLLLITSCIIGMPILVFVFMAFVTGGGVNISVKNNETGLKKQIGFNNQEEDITENDIELLKRCKQYLMQDQEYNIGNGLNIFINELNILIEKLNKLI